MTPKSRLAVTNIIVQPVLDFQLQRYLLLLTCLLKFLEESLKDSDITNGVKRESEV